LAELGARKDFEKSVELAALKADMQMIIDAVSAERDENLNNYTKVSRKFMHRKLFIYARIINKFTKRNGSCAKSYTTSSSISRAISESYAAFGRCWRSNAALARTSM
jgi:hypothetical protein